MAMPYIVVFVSVGVVVGVMDVEALSNLVAPSHMLVLVYAGEMVVVVMDADVAPAHEYYEHGMLLAVVEEAEPVAVQNFQAA